MEKNKKTLLLTFALIFIGMFLLAFVFASEDSREGGLQTSSTHVTQTYKTYESTKITTYKTYENTKVTEVIINPTRTSSTTNWKGEARYSCDGIHCSYERTPINTIHYTQYGTQETRKSFLGDYVKEYSAYVTNLGKTGRYFTVKFNFEDKNGYEFSQSITQYLRTGEKKRFVYRDIQYERNEILDWSYRIIPQR